MLLVPYSMIQYVVNDEISCTIQTTYALIFSQESESSVKLLGRELERLQIILLNLFSEKKQNKKKKQSGGCLSSRGRHTLPDFDLSPQLLLRTERYNKRLLIYSLFV